MNVPGAYAILLTTILTLNYASAQTKSGLNTEQLIGPVHTVQIEVAEITTVEGKEVESGRRLQQKNVYDRSGNEIERIQFNQDGSVQHRVVHIIDAHGRIAGWEEYKPEANGKGLRLTNRSDWMYNEKGNRIEARVYNQGALSHIMTARYDAAGHLIEEIMIADDGAWRQTKKLEYDSGGRLTKTVVDINGTIGGLTEQSYDSSGNLARYRYSEPDGRGNSEDGYSYDSHGREIERTTENSISKYKLLTSYDRRGRVSKRVTHFEYKQPNVSCSHAPEPGTVEFRYNDNDQIVEEAAYSPEGTLLRKTISEYDSAGRLRSLAYRYRDVVTKTTYEYDKLGNWIKSIRASSNGVDKPAVHVQHRVITYYDGK